jgi:integrase
MSKNGNGEGSIYPYKRNGKKVGYRGSYTVYTATGPKKVLHLRQKTREEVRQKLTKAMSDRDGGLVFDDGALTVGEHLERWLKDSVQGTVR